jgi:DNA recombination protein RmuC
MNIAIAALVGVACGAAIVIVVVVLRRRPAQELAQGLLEQAEQRHAQDLSALTEQLRGAFAELSQQALSANNAQFLDLARTRFDTQTKAAEATLEGKKKLVDETVRQIATRLTEIGQALQTQESARRQSHGELTQRLEATQRTTAVLQQTTAQLREALANPQRRGQWGERMAEDVLRLAGFVEGINYHKQKLQSDGGRPDFTFPLPDDRRVNMDVKFPLPNYLRYLDAGDDAERDRARLAFLRDVRQRIKEVTTREYIDPPSGTLDYVLVFIPNEQVYGFIHEHDPTLLDDALRSKVVLCSPLTLYAVLAVVRQAAENFRLEQASREILALLGAFSKEWDKYGDVVDRMGKSLAQATQHYETLVQTRARKLQRQIDQIEELRTQKQIGLPDDA